MGVTIRQNTLFLLDENGNLVPVGMFGTGVNESIKSIDEYAVNIKREIIAEAETAKNAITEKTEEQIDRIPEVNTIAENVNQIDSTFPPPIVCSKAGNVITIDDSADRPLRSITVYGKTTQDGTPSEDKPVDPMGTGTDSPLRIVTAGRNLATLMMRVGSNLGITSSYDAQTGVVTVTGTATGTAFVSYWLLDPIPAGVPLVIGMGNGSSDGNIAIRAQSASENANTTIATLSSTNRVVKVTLTHAFEFFAIRVNAGATVNMKMQIGVVAGSDIAGYTWTHPDDPTSAEIVIPDFHNTASGLIHGLPAISGGNYTDENGQQWITDTVEYDAETGTAQLVQRVASVTFDGSTDENWVKGGSGSYFAIKLSGKSNTSHGLCTHYQGIAINTGENNVGFTAATDKDYIRFRPTDYADMTVDTWREQLNASPVTVLYVLSDPEITQIVGDELTAIKSLRCRYPSTTVYNDALACSIVQYIADTKTYIDNRIDQAIKAYASQ